MLHMPTTPEPVTSTEPLDVLRDGVQAGEIRRVVLLLEDIGMRAIDDDDTDMLAAVYEGLVNAWQDDELESEAYQFAVDRIGLMAGWSL